MKLFTLIIFIIYVLIKLCSCENLDSKSTVTHHSNGGTTSSTLYCADLNPQNSMDVDQIMGLWYGNEVLTHHYDLEEGERIYDSCVVIHIAEVTHEMTTTEKFLQPTDLGYNYERNNKNRQLKQQSRFLKLVWDENGSTLEYTLRFNNSRRGFWISSGPQQGTMLNLPYIQFTGTVQVMKAVGSHLVLTFCQSLPVSQLFSIVLTRQPNSLSLDDIQSIRNLLKRRGLSTASIRKVCNGGNTVLLSFYIQIPLIIIYLFKKY